MDKSCKQKLQNTQAGSPETEHFPGWHYQNNKAFPRVALSEKWQLPRSSLLCCFCFVMTSNRNNNYQDVDMSRTASMQANLQTEFRARYFYNSLQSCSLLHSAWWCEVAFSAPESNTTPGFKDIPWREGSVFEKKPLSPDQEMFLLPMLPLHASLLKMTGKNSPSVVTQWVQIHNSPILNSCSAWLHKSISLPS